MIGFVGGAIYLLASLLLNRFQLDDPLQATQTHLFCGLFGVIAFGLGVTGVILYTVFNELFGGSGPTKVCSMLARD